MYSVSNLKYVNKGRLLDKTELLDIDGFLMASKNKVFQIQGCRIREIKVVQKKLANPLVSKKVFLKYERLITLLTELLLEDDDSGETCREALNHIEKFRLEIKNKYRAYLKKAELEYMSKQLMILQKEAQKRLLEIHNSYVDAMSNSNRSR